MRSVTLLSSVLVFCAACATSNPKPVDDSPPQKEGMVSSSVRVGGEVVTKTTDGFTDAALSPLEDFNLKRKQIPDAIKNYVSPYDPLPYKSCNVIAAEVQRLDGVLAKDFDVQIQELIANNGKKKKSSGKISNEASGLALNTIASEARGFIPFRGLVRQATGAKAHEKKVDDAFQRAYLRRAYLKGVGAGMNCTFPAAPVPYEMSDVLPKGAAITYHGAEPPKDDD